MTKQQYCLNVFNVHPTANLTLDCSVNHKSIPEYTVETEFKNFSMSA